MEIINYFEAAGQTHWLDEIKKSDWKAGQYLYGLLKTNQLKAVCGESIQVLLLVENDALISFCTYGERDEISDPTLKPWAGFVYTFPAFRGKRRMGKLLERVYALAKQDGYSCVYISTGEIGLYEKYGFSFWKTMQIGNGGDSRVYRKEIVPMDYGDVIGRTVAGTIDRPLGSAHPRHPEMIYPLNYGYVDGVIAGDGAEQDVYVFGIDQPIQKFTGRVIGVYHRLNDCEDKWIISVNGTKPDRETILRAIEFQEQYFMGELYL